MDIIYPNTFGDLLFDLTSRNMIPVLQEHFHTLLINRVFLCDLEIEFDLYKSNHSCLPIKDKCKCGNDLCTRKGIEVWYKKKNILTLSDMACKKSLI